MIKKMAFPTEEVELLKNRDYIVTTRVSQEYNRYSKGEIVQTPWHEKYIVIKIEKINNINDHPYYQDLTKKQIQLISRYKKINILTLKKYKTS